MPRTLPSLRTVLRLPLVAALVVAAAAFVPVRPGAFHFELVKSSPAADTTVQRIARVELWFSEPPTPATVRIHLLDASGKLVPTTDAAQEPDDADAFFVAPSAPVAPGAYKVAWRGMGDDGHVVHGEFGFSVTAP